MNIIWYLVIFGLDFNTSQAIPQVSKEQCLRNASWYEERLNRLMNIHAYCIEGGPR